MSSKMFSFVNGTRERENETYRQTKIREKTDVKIAKKNVCNDVTRNKPLRADTDRAENEKNGDK